MTTYTERVQNALRDVIAIEAIAPGMHQVTTWSGSYVVDGRTGACECPDKVHNLGDGEHCKHYHAARLTKFDVPVPYAVVDSLTERNQDDDSRAVTDGGQVLEDDDADAEPQEAYAEGLDQWTVADLEGENAFHFDKRAEADKKMSAAEAVPGVDPEVFAPGEAPEFLHRSEPPEDVEPAEPVATSDDDSPRLSDDVEVVETKVEDVDTEPVDPEPNPEPADPGDDYDLGERSVAEDPLNWVPGDFVDDIDGTQAINRKGFEVLAHFYDVDVDPMLEVPPEETDHTYCRVKCTAVTADDRVVAAYGSAHVDRGDDPELLLEMADTRARKRALSIATGVGAVAVEELKNEVGQ